MKPALLLGLAAWCRLSAALELYPPAYISMSAGQVVTVSPGNAEPTAAPSKGGAIGVSKAYASSNYCAKNVAYGCPGVELRRHPKFWRGNQTNGCGAETEQQLALLFNKAIDTSWAHDCCDQHDLCFGACNSTFAQCTTDFHNCLVSSCATRKNVVCAVAIPMYYGVVGSNIGCKVYATIDQDKPQCECPPLVNTTAPRFGRYQQYFWILDNYVIEDVRSGLAGIKTSDTNTILVGVDINGVPSEGGEVRKYQGKQGGGDKKSNPSLELNFWAFDSDEVTLWLSIYNGDLSAQSIEALNKATNLFRPDTAISTLAYVEGMYAPGMAFLGAVFSGITSGNLVEKVKQVFRPSCDGWVAQTSFGVSGTRLRAANSPSGPSETQIITHDGLESNTGCGRKSSYIVQTRFGLKRYGGEIPFEPLFAAAPPQTVFPDLTIPSSTSSSVVLATSTSSRQLASQTGEILSRISLKAEAD
jgi:hypothetical protein